LWKKKVKSKTKKWGWKLLIKEKKAKKGEEEKIELFWIMITAVWIPRKNGSGPSVRSPLNH